MLGIISEELDENTLDKKIKYNDIPEEVNMEKIKIILTIQWKKKKTEKRYKTSLRLIQRKRFETRAKIN